MITWKKVGSDYVQPLEGYGLSTDTKPTGKIESGSVDIPTGSSLYIISGADAGKVFMYDSVSATWIAQ